MAAVPSIPQNPSAEFTPLLETLTDLANRLLEKNAKGTLGSFTRDLESYDLLAVDEPGFLPPHRRAAELLFQVIASCYARRNAAITTNLEFGQWNIVINDSRPTAVLIDKLVHHGHVLAFTAESYRLRTLPPITCPR